MKRERGKALLALVLAVFMAFSALPMDALANGADVKEQVSAAEENKAGSEVKDVSENARVQIRGKGRSGGCPDKI